MTRNTDELQSLISEVEAFKAKIDLWGRAEHYVTDAGLGLSDVLSQWLGEAEREIATAHDHAMVHEMRRIQSGNSRGAE